MTPSSTSTPDTDLLTAGDRQSALWRKLRKHLEQRLQDLRKKNDGNLSELATAALRGEIRAIKRMLALDAQDGIKLTYDDYPTYDSTPE